MPTRSTCIRSAWSTSPASAALRNYYKDALDKLGVTVNVHARRHLQERGRAVHRQRAVAGGARGRQARSRRPLEDLRRRGREGEEARRRIDRCAHRRGAAAPRRGRRRRRQARAGRKARRRPEDARRAARADDRARRQGRRARRRSARSRSTTTSAHVRPRLTGDAIGVVVAEGEIVDGTAPAGTIGGLSTANLIQKARDDKDVKAIVLRVDSPGGSVFGSELVRRELEVTRAAGKPVVVSMGNLAASGGYWISTASDEIVADAGDDHRLDRRVRACCRPPTRRSTSSASTRPASATTWLRNADDPRLPLDPRLADLIQTSVDHTYVDFTTKVAPRARPRPTRSTRSRRGGSGPARRRKERGLVDTHRPVRRRAPLGRDARQARRQAAHRLHRARSGQVRAAREHAQRPGREPDRRRDRRAHRRGLGVAPAAACAARRATSAGSPRSPSAESRSRRSSTVSAAQPELSGRPGRRPRPTPQPRAARGRPSPGRPVPGAGRRRLGQDARDHPQDRAPARRPATQPKQIAAITFTNKAARRDARARASALVGARAAKDARDQHLPFARRAHAARATAQRSA